MVPLLVTATVWPFLRIAKPAAPPAPGVFTSITLGHIWVAVVIGGTTYLFDPSYKTHAFLPGVSNLSTQIGLDPGEALANATTGGGYMSGTDAGAGVPFVRSLNAESLNATLQSYGSSLLSYVEDNAPSARVEDLVGGQRIARAEIPAGGLRQTSLPYPAAEQRTWAGDIPDQYRTTLSVEIVKENMDLTTPTIVNQTFFVDEIYGRKLIVEPNFVRIAPNNSGANTFALRLINRAGVDVVAPLQTYSVMEAPTARNGVVTLTANHPFFPVRWRAAGS